MLAEMMPIQQTCARRNSKGSSLGRRNMTEMKKRDVSANITETHRIIKKYYERLCTNNLDKLEGMHKFLKNLQPLKT